jgi:hypothetical protein
MEKESDMKMPKIVFLGGALATLIVAAAIASVLDKQPSPTTTGGALQGSVSTHLVATPTTKAEPSTELLRNPIVDRIIEERQAEAAKFEAFRNAKELGAVPSELLRDRIDRTRATRPEHDNLDQGGDDCASATAIPFTPYSDFGTTIGFADSYPECDGSGTGPDVVYFYTPPQTADFHVSLCGSSYDTKIAVYANNCTGTPVACNDDGDCCPVPTFPELS